MHLLLQDSKTFEFDELMVIVCWHERNQISIYETKSKARLKGFALDYILRIIIKI